MKNGKDMIFGNIMKFQFVTSPYSQKSLSLYGNFFLIDVIYTFLRLWVFLFNLVKIMILTVFRHWTTELMGLELDIVDLLVSCFLNNQFSLFPTDKPEGDRLSWLSCFFVLFFDCYWNFQFGSTNWFLWLSLTGLSLYLSWGSPGSR